MPFGISIKISKKLNSIDTSTPIHLIMWNGFSAITLIRAEIKTKKLFYLLIYLPFHMIFIPSQWFKFPLSIPFSLKNLISWSTCLLMTNFHCFFYWNAFVLYGFFSLLLNSGSYCIFFCFISENKSFLSSCFQDFLITFSFQLFMCLSTFSLC